MKHPPKKHWKTLDKQTQKHPCAATKSRSNGWERGPFDRTGDRNIWIFERIVTLLKQLLKKRKIIFWRKQLEIMSTCEFNTENEGCECAYVGVLKCKFHFSLWMLSYMWNWFDLCLFSWFWFSQSLVKTAYWEIEIWGILCGWHDRPYCGSMASRVFFLRRCRREWEEVCFRVCLHHLFCTDALHLACSVCLVPAPRNVRRSVPVL